LPDVEPGPGPAAADLELLVTAAREAGAVALRHFRHDPAQWTKSGGSPVSEADLAADRALAERLRPARPGYGWLSEETVDGPDRLARRRLFVVDPIDGTRAFLAGSEFWTVSVAVVEDDRPIVAALHAPALGLTWTAVAGDGASLDGGRVGVAGRDLLSGARVSAPRRWFEAPAMKAAGFGEERLVPSLALRFARVADGDLDLAFASRNAHDWDLAAADLLVQEAGGRLTAANGDAPRYNRPVPRHPPLVAAGPGLYDAAMRLLARLEAVPK
jgi:myo-inositol-1(or 4)-monophosphatase